MENKLYLYTDGSCKGNGKKETFGGWGYVGIEKETIIKQGQGAEKNTTNQRMELIAAIKALEDFQNYPSIVLYSDSAYLINCWKEKWWKNWLKNNWRTAGKKPVANQDLWEKLLPFFQNNNIIFKKVLGHSGNEWNEYVDDLAQEAADNLR